MSQRVQLGNQGCLDTLSCRFMIFSRNNTRTVQRSTPVTHLHAQKMRTWMSLAVQISLLTRRMSVRRHKLHETPSSHFQTHITERDPSLRTKTKRKLPPHLVTSQRKIRILQFQMTKKLLNLTRWIIWTQPQPKQQELSRIQRERPLVARRSKW